MNKTPIYYTTQQQNELTDSIESFCEAKDSFIFHEVTSEYVHTDTLAMTSEDGSCSFATFGMSAKKQDTPLTPFEHIEILAFADKMDICSEDAHTIANELVHISKYPFRENSWLGLGHTIDAGTKFKEKFGYEYFVFLGPAHSVTVTDVGEVNYLMLVPIFEEELQWILQHDPFEYLQAFIKEHGELHVNLNLRRNIFIPQ